MYKNSGVAAVLSFFVPGLGQIYNGQFGRASVHLLFMGVGMFLVLIEPYIAIFIALINTMTACFSAYHGAEEYNANFKSNNVVAPESRQTYNKKQPSPVIWLLLPILFIVLVLLLVAYGDRI